MLEVWQIYDLLDWNVICLKMASMWKGENTRLSAAVALETFHPPVCHPLISLKKVPLREDVEEFRADYFLSVLLWNPSLYLSTIP